MSDRSGDGRGRARRVFYWDAITCHIVNAIELAVDADDSLRYDIFVSADSKWGYRDLSRAREIPGFAPRDAAEDRRGQARENEPACARRGGMPARSGAGTRVRASVAERRAGRDETRRRRPSARDRSAHPKGA